MALLRILQQRRMTVSALACLPFSDLLPPTPYELVRNTDILANHKPTLAISVQKPRQFGSLLASKNRPVDQVLILSSRINCRFLLDPFPRLSNQSVVTTPG